jgi:DHA1 family multidrug resistance protein-like MFS transporter
MENWKRTLYIMFIAQTVSAAGFSIFIPFLPLYVKALGTRTDISIELWIGMVFSSQAITMMIASPFWGVVADRYGRKLMVERAMFGGAVILFLMGFVRSAEELVFLRAIQGLITGTVAATNAIVAAVAPLERIGYAMGILQVGLWSGLAVGPLIGGFVADAFGFSAAFVITAAFNLLSGILVWGWVEEKFVPPRSLRRGFFSDWREIVSTPGIPVTFIVRFFSRASEYAVLPVMPLLVQRLLQPGGQVSTFTGLIAGAASGAGVLSAICLGRLGDRIGHRKILIGSALAAAVFYFLQSRCDTAGELFLFYVLGGAAIGGLIPSVSALLATFTHPESAGSVYGLDNSIVSAARTVAPLIGAGAAFWFGIRSTFVMAACFFILTGFFSFWSMPRDPKIPTGRNG